MLLCGGTGNGASSISTEQRSLTQFDELGELDGGLAFAKIDGKAGFVSSAGARVDSAGLR